MSLIVPSASVKAHGFRSELQSLIRARYPLVHINTFEEDRCLKVVREIARQLDQHMLVWSTSRGVVTVEPAEDADAARHPLAALAPHSLADLTAGIELFEELATARDRYRAQGDHRDFTCGASNAIPERSTSRSLPDCPAPTFSVTISRLTGAEIAAWVNEALIRTFDRRDRDALPDLTDPSIADFRGAIRDTVPLARMRRDDIRQMREWSSEHAVIASSRAKPVADDVVVEGRRLSL